MDTTETKTYRIPQENMASLQARLAKLQKRADKLVKKGLTAEQTRIGLQVIDTVQEVVKPTEDHPYERIRLFDLVQVTGIRPIVSGWEFVATLQHEEGGTILRAVPTAELAEGELSAYREAHTDCDHCKMNRRRNETFLVRNVETKVLKQVGRNCLADFLGGMSPEALAEMAEIMISLGEAAEGEEGFGGGGGGLLMSDLEDYLAHVAMIIREDGWLSRTKARETFGKPATADTAWSNRFPPRY